MRANPVIRYAAVFTAAPVLAAAVLAVSGYEVAPALSALWRGGFGSVDAVFSSTLVRTVPLILLGTAVAIGWRVGIFNIGGDGQFLVGAAAATWVALGDLPTPGPLRIALALLAAAAAGAGWGLLPAVLRWKWNVFEVLSTVMMNFIAAHSVSYLVRGPLQEPGGVYPQSAAIPSSTQLPILVPSTRLHTGFLLAVTCAIGAWIWMFWRAGGLRVRLTGGNPTAAASAGLINTGRVTFRVFLASAALCGMAGAVEVLGVSFALYENLSPSYGFTAIVVALLAGLHPLGILASALLLAGLDAGAAAMQRDAGVPSVAAWAIQALLVLVLLGVSALAERRRLLPRLAAR